MKQIFSRILAALVLGFFSAGGMAADLAASVKARLLQPEILQVLPSAVLAR